MKKNTKKIAIYDPYLNVLGGGEKYILSLAKIFDQVGYSIDILWDKEQITSEIEERLGFSFSNLTVVPNFLICEPLLKKTLETKKYEHLFYVTDGSYFFSLAEKNYVYAMIPQKKLYRMGLLDKAKLANFSFLTHSNFTKQFVDKWTGKKSLMIYPYLSDAFFLKEDDTAKKEKIILTVGRFFKQLHSKRQDVLIESFKELQQKHPVFKDFKLYLVGGLKDEDKGYFGKLKILAEDNKDIIFLPNASYELVLKYYRKAMFYWHAAGYGIDGKKTPHLVEHFGITPLEAMASSCVVFCYNSGGPKELIRNGKTGFLYSTKDELIETTTHVYKNKKMNKVSKKAQKYAKENFNYDTFKRKVKESFNLLV